MGPEVPGLDHGVEEDGGGEGDGEVQLAIEGRHLAPRHKPPVRVLHQHVSGGRTLLDSKKTKQKSCKMQESSI